MFPEVTAADEAALLELIFEFGVIGATPDGGVCRLAGSPADAKARRLFSSELKALGAAIELDPIGNQFGRMLFGTERGAILCGSHLDSQPTGGRFDGALGIAAAIVAARILARNSYKFRYRRDLILCNWTNEEGARFTPSLTGSSVFAGRMTLDQALRLTDANGETLGRALSAIGYLGSGTAPKDAVAAVELHIEQGPELEGADVRVGIVDRSWAARKMCLCFKGQPSHTGPTAKYQRRDALLAAARFVSLAHDLAEATHDAPVLSIARIENAPNSTNVIAFETRLWVEIRHSQESACETFGDRVLRLAEDEQNLGGCQVATEQDQLRPAVRLDPEGHRLATEICGRLGISWKSMATVAGHDALALSQVMPSTLIFVPSVGGISHSPKELTKPSDALTGLRVLVDWLHLRLLDEAAH